VSHYLASNSSLTSVMQSSGISVTLTLADGPSDEAEWRFREPLKILVAVQSRNELPDFLAVDLAFYSDEGAKLFAIQSDRFIQRPTRSVTSKVFSFEIDNPGMVCPLISIDVGLRDGDQSYFQCWQKAATLPVSLRGVPKHYVGGTIFCPAVQACHREEVSC
jgi:hypothetical protein